MEDAERQVKLILETLGPTSSDHILDLGCGEGRHVKLFHNHGLNIIGLDLSNVLISSGHRRFPELDLRVGDMRRIPNHYSIILSLFTSFGYFDADEENERIVKSVSAALLPGGWYWLDFLNPHYVRSSLQPETIRNLEPECRVTEHRRLESDMVIKDIIFQTGDGETHYQERVKLYERVDLENMMRQAGLSPAGSFGDYEGNQWQLNSPRTIIYARKNLE